MKKPHYLILDGLRGVAAITVVIFHLLEIFSGGDHTKQMINHGYLAVDFFFMLSGYVISHAYDSKIGSMTNWQFIKRRLIRLQPILIFGILLGGLLFYFSASPVFAKVESTSLITLLITIILGCLMIPVTVPFECRGWTEMYPLNGPAWSLFYEYVANIFYVIFLKNISNTLLALLVLVSGLMLADHAVLGKGGDLIGGWALDSTQIYIGLIRLCFPFLAGLLLARTYSSIKVSNGFLIASLLLLIAMATPRIGGHEYLWKNGIYDAAIVLFLFPIIILIGAGDKLQKSEEGVCKFLGEISYPLYITHFPMTYVYYAYVINNKIEMKEALPYVFLLTIVFTAFAYLVFKYYDVQIRKWLSK
jgi:peptidoglycan/LPS O-acetylase OafA/YrhL